MNEQERHLLHAILDKDESTAMSHFEAWSDSICFETIEGGSYRLIPALYRRISSLKPDFTHKNRMKGIYRYFLYKNRMLMHNSMQVLNALEEAKISYMLLKGAALIAAYYESPALRPMNDIDILVKREDAEKAFDLLNTLGWTNKKGRDFNQTFHSTHSIALKKTNNVDIDLHWNVIYQVAWKGSEKAYWEETEEAAYGNHTVMVLKPEMQILHNMAHGLRYNPMSAIRWIPDVMQIIETKKDAINWDHLLNLAKERHLVYTLRYGINLLADEFNAEIPAIFMENLRAIPVSKSEKKLHESMSRSSRFDLFKIQWQIYMLTRENDTLIKRMLGLPAYLKGLIGCGTNRELLRFLTKKVWQRIRKPSRDATGKTQVKPAWNSNESKHKK
jgi:hypothetical protein